MSNIIAMDDLEVGMKVTVHTGPNYIMQLQSGFMSMEIAGVIEKEDESGKGDILEIKAILLPYIIVEQISRYKHEKYPYKMDTRDRKFMKVSKEYEEALLHENEPKPVWTGKPKNNSEE